MSEVFILKMSDTQTEAEGELRFVGHLLVERTKDGELLEMFIERPDGDAEDLIQDNLLYFRKIDGHSYCWADVEGYPSCEEILIDEGDPHPSRAREELQRVMEDAEKTIELVGQGKPVQTQIQGTETGRLIVENNVRTRRPSRFRRLSGPRTVGADCDVSIKAKSLKKLSAVPAEFRSRAKVTIFAEKNGLILEFSRSGKRKRLHFAIEGSWKRRIELPARSLLNVFLKKASFPTRRLTFIADRLLVGSVSIAAKVAPLGQRERSI